MTEHVKKNMVLADFMGHEYYQPKEGDWLLFDFRNNLIDYSNDYNMLMPVAEKLVKGYPFGNKYFGKQAAHNFGIFFALENFDKVILFDTCYNFIAFLNKTNQCK